MNIRPATPDDLPTLAANAREDNHVVIAATHVVEDDKGRIVGYGSIGAVHYFGCWLDSQRVNAMQSVQLLKESEALARKAGITQVMMPCSVQSPFYPYMEKLGFTALGSSTFNIKSLTTDH